MHQVTFTIGETSRTIEVAEGANLLQAAIEQGVPVEYVCKSGRCCTCKIKVLEGVCHLSPPTHNEAFRLGRDKLKRDWRLACQTDVTGPVHVSHTAFVSGAGGSAS